MKLIILCLSICYANVCNAQVGKVHGVITYFFNDYQGDKPDLGAQVYAIDSAKCPAYNSDVSFRYYLASIKKTVDDSLDKQNAHNNNEIRFSNSAKTTRVDGAGNFELDLPVGTYYVLIKSKGRTGATMSDVLGITNVTKVKVKSGETVDVSHNFGMYY